MLHLNCASVCFTNELVLSEKGDSLDSRVGALNESLESDDTGVGVGVGFPTRRASWEAGRWARSFSPYPPLPQLLP